MIAMKNRQKTGTFILSVLVLVMILLSSCNAMQIGTSKKPQNFREGTEGIALSFLPTIPKEIIVTSKTNEPISFFIELKNNGAFPGAGQSIDGSLWLSGFDPSIIELDQQSETTAPFTSSAYGTLQGRTSTNAVGSSATHEFKGVIKTGDEILSPGKYSPTILANVCYSYETIANPVVCVEKDAFSIQNQRKPCVVSDISLSSQGAPIAITKVETITTGDRVQFKMTVKNVGKGTVIDKGVSCNPKAVKGVLRYQLDLITISSVKISDQNLECNSPEQKVRLIDGVGFFTCSLEKSKLPQQQLAFTTPLDIALSYLYKETSEKPIVINKIQE